MNKRTILKNDTLHSIYLNIRNIDLLYKNIQKKPQVGPNNNKNHLNTSGH